MTESGAIKFLFSIHYDLLIVSRINRPKCIINGGWWMVLFGYE